MTHRHTLPLAAQLPSQLAHAKKQTGLSMFGILMLLIVLAAFMNIGLTLGPHYMDNRAIVQVVETLDPSLWKGSKTKIHTAINKGLKVNSVRTIKSEDAVQIEKVKGMTKATVAYEIRENLIANVDAVLVFNKEYSH